MFNRLLSEIYETKNVGKYEVPGTAINVAGYYYTLQINGDFYIDYVEFILAHPENNNISYAIVTFTDEEYNGEVRINIDNYEFKSPSIVNGKAIVKINGYLNEKNMLIIYGRNNLTFVYGASDTYVKMGYIDYLDNGKFKNPGWVLKVNIYSDYFAAANKSAITKFNYNSTNTSLIMPEFIGRSYAGMITIQSYCTEELKNDLPPEAIKHGGALTNILLRRFGDAAISSNMSYVNILFSTLRNEIWQRFLRLNVNDSSFEYKGPWKRIDGAKGSLDIYYALGDSITAGSYSNENREGIAVSDAEWSYPNIIGRNYGCTVYNLGVPGAALTEMYSQASQVNSNATIITITGGANDFYGRTIQLGSMSDTSNSNSITGKLKYIIEYLGDKCKMARIYLISPWIIARGDNASASTQWSKNAKVANKGNFTYQQLADRFQELANYYNIGFIDGTNNGPINVFNVNKVQTDNVHPTKDFYYTIASWLGGILF